MSQSRSAADLTPKVNYDIPEYKIDNEDVQGPPYEQNGENSNVNLDTYREYTTQQVCSEKKIIQCLPLKDNENVQISQSSDQNESQVEVCETEQKEGGEHEQSAVSDNLLALSLQKVR